MKFVFAQIMNEFDNDNFYYENESDDELPMQQSSQGNALPPLSQSDAPMPEQDNIEPQNNIMVEDEVPLILEKQPLNIELNENVPQCIEPMDQPMVVDDDKENENPIELLKGPMPPPPLQAL